MKGLNHYNLTPQTPTISHTKIDYWFRRSSCMYSFSPFMNSRLFTLLYLSEPFIFSISISSQNFFFFFLVPKAFWSFLVFQTLKTCAIHPFSFSFPFAKKNSPRTNRLNSFCVSLLPFQKERRTNRLNSFVSPFSLVKEFKTTQSENSFDSSHSLIQKSSKD